jgi:hypothetical protein
MTRAELIIADSLISGQLDLLRLGAYSQTEALALLDELGRVLESMLKTANLTGATKVRINSILSQAVNVIDRYYEEINRRAATTLTGMAQVQAQASARSISSALITVGTSLPSQTFLERLLTNSMIFGAKSASWWQRQAGDTAFRFAAAVRQGLVQGETNEQIVRRVVGTTTTPGVLTASRANARSLVHASIQTVANEARLETFRANADIVKGVKQLSTLDSHTTDICIAYSGAEWDLQGDPINKTKLPFLGGPPRHWGCRSVLVPITKTFKELGIDLPEPQRSQRASADGPIDAGTTFTAWLKRQSKEDQEAQLGKGRAELWRKGKITLTQLLDLKGNPMTLKQLERKYA